MRKTVYWIEGDGIGPDVWKSARPVIDEAIRLSYGDERGFDWKELLAGEKALKETGTLLPDETLAALRGAELAIKGPLGTPVGTGFRSLNVTLRQTLDLYACIRPIRYFEGIESPVKHPERLEPFSVMGLTPTAAEASTLAPSSSRRKAMSLAASGVPALYSMPA